MFSFVTRVMMSSQDAIKGLNKRQGARDGVGGQCPPPSHEGPHTAQEPQAWLPASRTLLAWDSCFSAVLEKRKSAKEKAAQQSEGTQLLEGVGTVPAEVSERLCLASSSSSAWAGLARGPPLRRQGLVSQSLDSHS